jgi:hypothetical protein
MMRCRLGRLITLRLGLLAAPLAAAAPPPRNVPRIGLVTGGGDLARWPLELDAMPVGFPKAFRQGLRALGYVEGHTILVE